MKVFVGYTDNILKRFDNDISCFHVKLFKEDSKAAFVLLKHIIEQEGYQTDYYVKYTQFRKPYLKGIYYNVSHSKGRIAIAISESEVGIDIQKNVDTIVNVKSKYYSESDFEQNLLRTWVIKESYLKYLGIGLINDLYNVRIGKEEVTYPDYGKAYYKCFDLDDDYALAVCNEKKEDIEIIYI
ncbi:MAG: 4'-phosphopantetheinyl transferase superfamily protein [Bacilli bacterium]|nr:4'-phosphopantetheinyl transferase superfamily protein [Bacilli bacterium]